MLAFGDYPPVTLVDARLRRAEAKIALGKGVDPTANDAPETVIAFKQVALAWHDNPACLLDTGQALRALTQLERDAFSGIRQGEPAQRHQRRRAANGA